MFHANKFWLRYCTQRILHPVISDELFVRLLRGYLHRKMGLRPKPLNLDIPQSFSEKIIWLKLNYRFPNGHLRADKVLVRDFVAGVVGDHYLVPTLQICSNAEDIDFDKLPSAFVAKASHGSAWNIVCDDKKRLNKTLIRQRLNKWLSYNYYYVGREWQYRDCPPRIIVEQHLNTLGDEPLHDYKFFCFNGIPKLIQVDIDRHTNHSRNFYDTSWHRQPFGVLFPQRKADVAPPICLTEMLKLATVLSSEMPFARIDLYCQGRKVYFGEITFHPGGGCEPFTPTEFDYVVGEMLVLPS